MVTEDGQQEQGPEIVTTELGKRLFQERLAEMRKVKPDLKEPRWVIREVAPADENRHTVCFPTIPQSGGDK